MKRYIKSNRNSVLQLQIELLFECTSNIKAAYNPDLSDEELDKIIDESIEDDYISFMESVASNLVLHGYEVLEGPSFSNQQGSKSCYFTICKANEYETLTVEFILNVRISNHRLTTHKGKNSEWNRFEARKEYYQKELESYLELNEEHPENLDYGIKEIFISGHKFKTYRQALRHILNKIDEQFR